MSACRFTYYTTLDFGADGEPSYTEVEIEVSYTVAWGTPETGRFGPVESYDPGSADEIEDIRLETVEGKPRPWDMGYGFISDDQFAAMVIERLEGSADHRAAMIVEASDAEIAAYEDACERRREERRERAQ